MKALLPNPFAIGIALFLGGAGMFLAFGGGSGDGRGVWWKRRHLEVMEKQLDGLETMLKTHREKHGSYPTTTQGLAALTHFASRFPVEFERRSSYEPGTNPYSDSSLRQLWLFEHRGLESYFMSKGRYPSSIDEMMHAGIYLHGAHGPDPVSVDMAISPDGIVYFASKAGVLSPWGIPYVYENRNGAPENTFRMSYVDDGTHYSLRRVDEGVFVYSLAAMHWEKEYLADRWRHKAPKFVGLAMLVAGVVLILLSKGRGAIAFVAAGAAAFFSQGVYQTSCYVMAAAFYRRPTRAVAESKELLRSFADDGLITEETYKASIRAIDGTPEKQ